MIPHGNHESLGVVVANRYRIDQVLAEGGMSVLFRGCDLHSDHPVAIKRMRIRDFSKSKYRKRFQQEIETAARLRHPNIVQVQDSGADDQGRPYLVMEFLHGTSLEAELSKRGGLPVEQALEWLLPLFGALGYAHGFGVVHRDIKPANIFLSGFETGLVVPKLLDFGISMVMDATRVTQSGTVVGTVQYMSPEQAKDEPIGASTDVWSMGVVLFRCLTGKLPFEASTQASILYKIVHDAAPELISITKGIGKRFCAAIDRALTKEVARRYADMRSFAEALCISAHSDGIKHPSDPDPIGLPQWPIWISRSNFECSYTEELPADSVPTQSNKTESSLRMTPGSTDPDKAQQSENEIGTRSRIKTGVYSRFIGRQKETESLLKAYLQALGGSGRAVGIVGEAGVGKTRLLREMRNRLDLQEQLYLEGGCRPYYGSSTSYFPILQLLRGYFGIKKRENPNRLKQKLADKVLALDKSLSDTVPALNTLFFIDTDDEGLRKLQQEGGKSFVWQSLQRLFITISKERPLVIAIEDLHWVDRSSQEFIDYFINSIMGASVLLILGYRSEYNHNWSQLPQFSEIKLDRLSKNDSTALFQSILGEEDSVDFGLQDLIWRRAHGNPFYIEEFTHTLLETGTIKKDAGGYSLNAASSSIPYSDNVEEFIAVRIASLEQTVKQTLQVASVVGPDIFAPILKRISGVRNELDAHLKNLERLQFLHNREENDEPVLAFKHTLIQQTAYESLSEDSRRDIHNKTAKALEEAYSQNLQDLYETLAYHHMRAGNWDKAIHYSQLSGEKAAGNYNHEAAIQFYQQAITVLDSLPESEETQRRNFEMRFLLNTSYLMQGYPSGSLENMLEMERLSKSSGDSLSLALSYCTLNGYYSHVGNQKKSSAFAELSVEEALQAEDVEIVASLLSHLYFNFIISGEMRKIIDLSPRAIHLFEKTGRTSEEFNFPFLVYPWILECSGGAFAAQGQFNQGINIIDKAYVVAQQANHLPTLGVIELGYCVLYYMQGQGSHCIEHANRALDFIRGASWLTEIPHALAYLGAGYYLLGDLQRAKEALEEACNTRMTSLIAVFMWVSYYSLAFVNCDLGRLDEAHKQANKSLDIANEAGDILGQSLSTGLDSLILSKTDPTYYVRAEEHIDSGFKRLDQLALHGLRIYRYYYLARLYAETRQRQKALERLEELQNAIREMEKMGMDFWLVQTREYLAKALAS